MDKISINELKVLVHIGLSDEERKNPQELIIDLTFQQNVLSAAQADNIEKTVNYAQVCQTIIDFSKQAKFKLVETFAERLSQILLQQFKMTELTLTVTKKPYDLPQIKNISVTIQRKDHYINERPQSTRMTSPVTDEV